MTLNYTEVIDVSLLGWWSSSYPSTGSLQGSVPAGFFHLTTLGIPIIWWDKLVDGLDGSNSRWQDTQLPAQHTES